MRVMEVNRKGWTAWCMDITRRGLRGAKEEGGVCAPLHNLTKDTDFLVAKVFFYKPLGMEETSRGKVALKNPFHPRLVKSDSQGKSEASF